ncbi:MAG: hypothetical protein ACREM2_03670 [Vulcanimicrobiaceae bacterium]
MQRRAASAIGLFAVALLASLPAGSATGSRAASGTPLPEARPQELRGYGALAVRQAHDLYLVDGEAPASARFRRIERGAPVLAMAWSHDGRLLAYQTPGALWIAARAGGAPRRIARAGALDRFAWSPRADLLLVTRYASDRMPEVARHAVVDRGTTTLIDVGGAALERLPLATAAHDVIWSRDGRRIVAYAYHAVLPYASFATAADALYVVRHVSRGAIAGGVRVAKTAPGGQLSAASLWPSGRGLLYWQGAERSASLAADGLTLRSVRFGKASRKLGTMIPSTSWLSWAPDGRSVAFVDGALRLAWYHKSLVVCEVEPVACRTIAPPRGTVALDPAWSRRGDAIVFVRAPDLGSRTWGFRSFAAFEGAWLSKRTLWLADAHTGTTRELASFGRGIYWPRWSRDGRRILFVREGGVWLGKLDGEAPAEVVSGMPTPREAPDQYFGSYGDVSPDDDPVAWTGS